MKKSKNFLRKTTGKIRDGRGSVEESVSAHRNHVETVLSVDRPIVTYHILAVVGQIGVVVYVTPHIAFHKVGVDARLRASEADGAVGAATMP